MVDLDGPVMAQVSALVLFVLAPVPPHVIWKSVIGWVNIKGAFFNELTLNLAFWMESKHPFAVLLIENVFSRVKICRFFGLIEGMPRYIFYGARAIAIQRCKVRYAEIIKREIITTTPLKMSSALVHVKVRSVGMCSCVDHCR